MYIFFTFCILRLLHHTFCPAAYILFLSPHTSCCPTSRAQKKVPRLAARNFLPNYFFFFLFAIRLIR